MGIALDQSFPVAFRVIEEHECPMPTQWRYFLGEDGEVFAGPPVVGDSGGFEIGGSWSAVSNGIQITLRLVQCREPESICKSIRDRLPSKDLVIVSIDDDAIVFGEGQKCAIIVEE